MIIQSNFFQYIYHVGCAINLHSIISSGSKAGGQILSNRQTVFFLLVDPMDKNHKDPDTIDLNAPRHVQYLHKTWKRHQDAVYWVDINLAIEKGLKFYQTRSNAIILQETLPAYCIPKVGRMETGDLMYEQVYVSPRPPPKISLKHEWIRECGSEHAERPEVGQLPRSFQSNQPILNPNHERTGQPVVRTDRTGQPVVGTNTRTAQDGRKTSRSQEIDTRSFHEEAVKNDRTEQPVVETGRTQTRSSDDSKSLNVEMAHEREERPVVNHDDSSLEETMLNEVNMDFLIPGLPHSVVKHAQSISVRELFRKLRTTQIDTLFNKICDKIKLISLSVQSQSK